MNRIKFDLAKKYICLLHGSGISVYDPVDQSCELLSTIPIGSEIPFTSHIITVNHKIVLLHLKHYLTANIWIYDLLSRTWKQGAEIPTARSGTGFACCASPEGSIYIAGGCAKYGNAHELREAAVYKVNEDKWELLPQMHEKVGSCRGLFIEGMFYVINNWNNGIQRFDPNTGIWTTIETMTAPNSWYVHFRGLIAFLWNGIQQYDWEGKGWRELEPLPQQLYPVRATVWCDHIFLCGRQYYATSIHQSTIFYMYKPGAPLSERCISIGLNLDVTSVATIEI
ncbi:hypothetical protein SUGI_0701310 [Cryptomeria japonica]|nr:hypothetical protein SUGI_0701310 [Cryptomeria japonica]